MGKNEILIYLKKFPKVFLSYCEIAKKADRRAYRKSRDWARPLLRGLVLEKVVEMDAWGGYRACAEPEDPKRPKPKTPAELKAYREECLRRILGWK